MKEPSRQIGPLRKLWSYTHSSKFTFIETDGYINQKVTGAGVIGRLEQNNRRARLFDDLWLSKSPDFTILDSCLVSFAPTGQKFGLYGYFAQMANHTGLVTKFQ